MDDNCVHPVTRLFSVRHIWKLLVKKVRAGEDRSDTTHESRSLHMGVILARVAYRRERVDLRYGNALLDQLSLPGVGIEVCSIL